MRGNSTVSDVLESCVPGPRPQVPDDINTTPASTAAASYSISSFSIPSGGRRARSIKASNVTCRTTNR